MNNLNIILELLNKIENEVLYYTLAAFLIAAYLLFDMISELMRYHKNKKSNYFWEISISAIMLILAIYFKNELFAFAQSMLLYTFIVLHLSVDKGRKRSAIVMKD